MQRKKFSAAAFALALTITVAACGDDDEATDTTAATAATADTAVTATTETADEADTATTEASEEAEEAEPATTAEAEEADTATTAAGEAPMTEAPDLSEAIAACEAEGNKVNLIALPDEWANYKGILAAFGEKYPDIEYPVSSPNASSQEEVDAILTLAGQDDMPDSVDVSPAVGQSMVEQGLFEPYTSVYDAEIPAGLKDPDGHWYAAYYGIMAISTNTTIVDTAPETWADLANPEYAGQVSLNGDPRESGAAFAAVVAASLANGGSADDIMPGIEFFAELQANGNLASADITPATVLSGETPIAIDWSYNVPGLAQQMADQGFEFETHFPADGIYGGYYEQGLVTDSPHQNCSKLWLEHILSDEGALGYLEGGAVPARITSLTERGLVTDDMKVNLPADELLDQVNFLTQEQVAAAKEALAENWGPMVADA
ncbi:MAG TPA: ABC transporter substrate-binding protein [Ilumatobacter sp.]|nr:ABC transporter substrate-binding protein [Ilumatobacter sp.]